MSYFGVKLFSPLSRESSGRGSNLPNCGHLAGRAPEPPDPSAVPTALPRQHGGSWESEGNHLHLLEGKTPQVPTWRLRGHKENERRKENRVFHSTRYAPKADSILRADNPVTVSDTRHKAAPSITRQFAPVIWMNKQFKWIFSKGKQCLVPRREWWNCAPSYFRHEWHNHNTSNKWKRSLPRVRRRHQPLFGNDAKNSRRPGHWDQPNKISQKKCVGGEGSNKI